MDNSPSTSTLPRVVGLSPVVGPSRTLHHLTQHRVVLVLNLRMMLIHVRPRVDSPNHFGRVAGDDRILFHVLQNTSQLKVRLVAVSRMAHLGHDRPGADHRAAPDPAERQDNHVPADEAVLPHRNRARDEIPFATLPLVLIHTRRDPIELDVRPDNRPGTNVDLARILHVAARLHEHRVGEMDVIAVVAGERRVDQGRVADIAFRPAVGFVKVLRAPAGPEGRLDDGAEETALFFRADAAVGAGRVVVFLEGGAALLAVVDQLAVVVGAEGAAEQHLVFAGQVRGAVVG